MVVSVLGAYTVGIWPPNLIHALACACVCVCVCVDFVVGLCTLADMHSVSVCVFVCFLKVSGKCICPARKRDFILHLLDT